MGYYPDYHNSTIRVAYGATFQAILATCRDVGQ